MAILAASKVQTGTYTFGTTEATKDITISSVDTTHAYLMISSTSTNTDMRMNKTYFRAQIINGTTIRIDRDTGADVGPIVNWQVVEFSSAEANCYQGTATCTADPTDVTVTSVNTAKAFPIVFFKTSILAAPDGTDIAGVSLTSSTNLRIDFGAAPSGTQYVVGWQVVELVNSSVQTGTTSLVALDNTEPATISSVTLTKSFLISTFNTATAPSDPWNRIAIRGIFTNATTITFDRVDGGSGQAVTMRWHVISFTNDATVQNGSYSFAAADAQEDATITAITIAESAWVAAHNWQQTKGDGSGASANNDSDIFVRYSLTSTTNIRGDRGTTSPAITHYWQLVTYTDAASGTPAVPSNTRRTIFWGGIKSLFKI